MHIELENQFMLITYRSKSLTKTAQALGISQPALSMRISKAEEKLGFKVFDRGTSPLGLTKEGELYLEYLVKQERLIREYTRRLEEMEAGERLSLIIGGPSLYLETIIADAVIRINESYPQCRIKLKNASLPELILQAQEGLIDCFISTSNDLPENFEQVEIKRERLYLCIPADWEINGRSRGDPETGDRVLDYSLLNGMDFIFMEENQPLQKELNHLMEDYGLSPKSTVQVNQVTTGMVLAAKGKGIFLASEEAIANCQNADRLAVYALPETYSGRPIYMAYDQLHYLSPACREFITLMQTPKSK